VSDALLRGDGVAGDGIWDERCEAVDADLHLRWFPFVRVNVRGTAA
jgi:hypothetical protein